MAIVLQGMAVAITRSESDAAEFIQSIKDLGGRPVPLPTIRLVARGKSISATYMQESEEYKPDYTVFMSSKAVELLLEDAIRHKTLEKIRLSIANSVVVSVGPKTSQMLQRYNIQVNFEPESVYSSVGVGEVLSRMDRTRHRILIPRSGSSTPFLRQLLEKLGFSVREVHLYDAVPNNGEPVWEEYVRDLQENRVYGMIFTSVSSVRAFFKIISKMNFDAAPQLSSIRVVSIGPFTSEELSTHGIPHITATSHTVAGALDTLVNDYSRSNADASS